MRPGRTPTPPQTLTRRALGTRFAGAAAAIGFGQGASASGAANPMPVLDPDLCDAALRGLALAGYRGDQVTAAAADLAILHAAIRACQPVAFGYTDLSGNETTRTVLPLALVHPPQGVKLLAWCAEREDFRQFFVRAMQGPTPRPGNFSDDRMALLEGLLDKESGRD